MEFGIGYISDAWDLKPDWQYAKKIDRIYDAITIDKTRRDDFQGIQTDQYGTVITLTSSDGVSLAAIKREFGSEERNEVVCHKIKIRTKRDRKEFETL